MSTELYTALAEEATATVNAYTEAIWLFDSFLQEEARAATSDAPHEHMGDPVGFIEQHLGEFLWSKQKQIARAVQEHRKVVVRSCHEAGKSWLMARIICWWLETNPVGEAFVVTTAPTWDQVQNVLWREINRAHRKGNLKGKMNLASWYINGEIVAFGRKPADTNQAAFQGIHARRVLVAIDEACGVVQAIWTAANSLVANEHSKLFAIGNPDDSTAYMAEVCRNRSLGWHVEEISAFDTPNFTNEEIPDSLRELLVSPIYEQEVKAEFGVDSITYQSKVLGRFSDQVQDALIPMSWLQATKHREPREGKDSRVGIVAGLDVAGPGEAETVLYWRRGNDVLGMQAWTSPDPRPQVIAKCRELAGIGLARVNVDAAGLGWDMAIDLRDALRANRVEVRGVNVGYKSRILSDEGERVYENLKAELYWGLRARLRLGVMNGLVDERTIGQLADIRYTQPRGIIRIETKDEALKRGVKSPDRAEAFMFMCAPPSVEDAVARAFEKDAVREGQRMADPLEFRESLPTATNWRGEWDEDRPTESGVRPGLLGSRGR